MQQLRRPSAAHRAGACEAVVPAARSAGVGDDEPARTLYWSFPGSPLDVNLSRAWLAAAVTEAWGEGDDADRVVLAYSEIATNAVIHGRGPVTVAMRINPGGATCDVADCSPKTPQPRHADPEDVSGRGLEMVRMTVDRLRVVADEIGKTVSFAVKHRQITV